MNYTAAPDGVLTNLNVNGGDDDDETLGDFADVLDDDGDDADEVFDDDDDAYENENDVDEAEDEDRSVTRQVVSVEAGASRQLHGHLPRLLRDPGA